MLTCWFVRLRMVYRILCIWAFPVTCCNSQPAIVASIHDARSSHRRCICTAESMVPSYLYRSRSSSLCVPKTIVLLPVTFVPRKWRCRTNEPESISTEFAKYLLWQRMCLRPDRFVCWAIYVDSESTIVRAPLNSTDSTGTTAQIQLQTNGIRCRTNCATTLALYSSRSRPMFPMPKSQR